MHELQTIKHGPVLWPTLVCCSIVFVLCYYVSVRCQVIEESACDWCRDESGVDTVFGETPYSIYIWTVC